MSMELLENHGLEGKRMMMMTTLAGMLTNQKLPIGRHNFQASILPVPACFNLQIMDILDTEIVQKRSHMFVKRKNFHQLQGLLHPKTQTKIHHQPLQLRPSLQHHAPVDWQTGKPEL